MSAFRKPLSERSLPYGLCRKGETTRCVRDLIRTIAQLPHFPKMLNRPAILEILLDRSDRGRFILQSKHHDGLRFWWCRRPHEGMVSEQVLTELTVLAELSPALLEHDVLSRIWDRSRLRLCRLMDYFEGG